MNEYIGTDVQWWESHQQVGTLTHFAEEETKTQKI